MSVDLGMGYLLGGFLVVAIGIYVVLWQRRRRASRSIALAFREGPKSPMAFLSFEEAISLQRFSSEIQRYELESLTRTLGLAPLQCAIQGVSIAKQGHGVTVLCRMSEAGRRAYESGQARLLVHKGSTKVLPVLQDVETGRTFEIMKGHTTKWLKLSELSTIVVSAAHIISGMDLSRKLSEANLKLDRLLKARRDDQISILEQVFAMSKERLLEGPTDDGIKDLRKYRGDLRKLRGDWRRDIARAIEDAPDPSIKPRWKFWGRKGRERRMVSHINTELSTVGLLYVAFLMDVCLAEATGTTELLLCHTIPDELKALEKLAVGLSGKSKLLMKSRGGLGETQHALNGLCKMLDGVACGSHGESRALAARG
jgi:hypothetical protein